MSSNIYAILDYRQTAEVKPVVSVNHMNIGLVIVNIMIN